MSSLELNKIVGAILLVVLTLQVVTMLGDSLVRSRSHGPAAISVANAPAPGPKPEIKIEPVSGLIATANVENGKKIAAKCVACHTLNKGEANKIGPNQWGVIGRPFASHEGFQYSSALKAKGGTWDYETLNAFIAAPSKTVPGTKMTFAGLDKVKDRADLIAYLRTLSDSPAPVPPADSPAPAQQ